MAGFHDAVSNIAEREAIKQLEGKKFDVKQGGFVGYVEAVDPNSNVDIAVDEFNLGADTLTVGLQIAGRFQIVGMLEQGGSHIDVKATMDAVIFVDGKAKLSTENGSFFVDPDVDDLNATVDILSLKPENLNGGKELISTLANAAFTVKKAEILWFAHF